MFQCLGRKLAAWFECGCSDTPPPPQSLLSQLATVHPKQWFHGEKQAAHLKWWRSKAYPLPHQTNWLFSVPTSNSTWSKSTPAVWRGKGNKALLSSTWEESCLSVWVRCMNVKFFSLVLNTTTGMMALWFIMYEGLCMGRNLMLLTLDYSGGRKGWVKKQNKTKIYLQSSLDLHTN